MVSTKLKKSEFKTLSISSVKEVIFYLYGRALELPNGWGPAIVCGAWKFDNDIRILLAFPNEINPKQLFNERLKDLTE